MSNVEIAVNEVTQMHRVLARIAIANDEIDAQEKLIIVSNIGGAAHLSDGQLRTLIDDVSAKPDVLDLISGVKQPIILRQLIAQLAAFSLLKKEWHKSEIHTLKEAVSGMEISSENRATLLMAFDALRTVSQEI